MTIRTTEPSLNRASSWTPCSPEKTGIQVQQGNKTEFYKFGDGGKGVYVALIDKKRGEDTDNVGQNGNSVYTPQFVTLAHELGHALNILVGAGTIECRDLFATLRR